MVAVDSLKSGNMAGDMIEKLTKFCNLEDLLCIEDGAQEAVIARIKVEWKRFKYVAGALSRKFCR